MVNSLFLKKPERIEALGLVVWLALLIWRLMERSLRLHIEMTGNALPGWDKQETTRPTACMMMTKFARLLVIHARPMTPQRVRFARWEQRLDTFPQLVGIRQSRRTFS